MVRICLYVHVCVALPMIVGAWSMAVVLWQLLEYYYYCYSIILMLAYTRMLAGATLPCFVCVHLLHVVVTH